MTTPIRRALLSVSNKDGLVDLARALRELNIEILSTGGTAALLEQHGIEVKQVSAHTGFPEIMDGRVKTLHPKIHGGLLGRRGIDEAAGTGVDWIARHVLEILGFLLARAERWDPPRNRCLGDHERREQDIAVTKRELHAVVARWHHARERLRAVQGHERVTRDDRARRNGEHPDRSDVDLCRRERVPRTLSCHRAA